MILKKIRFAFPLAAVAIAGLAIAGEDPRHERHELMEGVGDHFVPGYHHRYNAIAGNPRGAVTGAILNGFVRAFPHVDRPWLDLYAEPNADYHANEPWLLQNNRWLEIIAWW